MSDAHPTDLAPQTSIRRAGRYELRERVGEGAMGVVYAAFDPQLQRRLAVKLVAPRRDSPRERERLLREAQAMARVQHPNVVSVHDVGEADGQVFVAMDYIDGVTLAEWLGRGPHHWREIVSIHVQAGRGLAAAHAAGLIHRDFKPHNVLVDQAGIARVADFGLVRALEASSSGSGSGDGPDETTRARRAALFEHRARGNEDGTLDDDTVTQAGAIVGTPAYMAPEQSQGHVADPRSDQYSFCVALYEGLYQRRPSADALTSATGPRRSDVSPRIHAAIVRGLSTDPDARWPSMTALLDELERVRFHVSPRIVLASVAVIGVVALAITARDRLIAWWHPVTLTFPVAQMQVIEPMALHESPSGDVYASSTEANQGRLVIDVELPTSGRYYLHGLVWESRLGGERGDADSLFVYIDGGEEKLWHFGCQNERMPEHVLVDHWAWQPVLHMANADSDCEIEPELAWDLDAGPHHLVFRNREEADSPEAAARLARVVITNQHGWRP